MFHCPACRLPSAVLWAQRSSSSDPARNVIYLTIAAPDVPQADLKLDLQPARLTFSGTSTTKHVTYNSVMEFYEEIDPKESTVNHTDRDIELVLRKKEAKDEFWPRLLKAKAKVHWLKTNFDKVFLSSSLYAAADYPSGSTRRTRTPRRTRTGWPRLAASAARAAA